MMFSVSTPPPQHMQCMEVWGGSQLTAQAVELGGIDTWVYSKPFRLSERLAVYPRVDAAKFNSLRGELAATPDFHALHMLRRRCTHTEHHTTTGAAGDTSAGPRRRGITQRDLRGWG